MNLVDVAKQEGLDKDIAGVVYEMVPGLFASECVLEKYCSILKSRMGFDYCKKLNTLYYEKRDEFNKVFEAETIEKDLGWR